MNQLRPAWISTICPGGQSSKFGLFADQQDRLPLFCAETVADMAMTAFMAIDISPITIELPAPALQRCESHALKPGQLNNLGSISDAHIKAL
jgi:hypothetical protein